MHTLLGACADTPLSLLIDLLIASRISDETALLDFGRQLAASLGLPCNPVGGNNAKTGTPATYRPVGPTCPPCPISETCYAKYGRVKLHAKRSQPDALASLTAAAIAIVVALKGGSPARLHVSGDFFADGLPDAPYITGLVELTARIRPHFPDEKCAAWTYTHGTKELFEPWRLLLEEAGVRVLYSDIIEPGCAVVWPFSRLSELKRKAPQVTFLRCPAQRRKGVTCRTCKRCLSAVERNECIVFDPH